jgi:hypothetical protein
VASRVTPSRAWQLDQKLKDEPWTDVAEFAAACVQSRALHLKPWETALCDIYDGDDDSPGKRLLKRMLKAGVSRYAPDPLAALEAAQE